MTTVASTNPRLEWDVYRERVSGRLTGRVAIDQYNFWSRIAVPFALRHLVRAQVHKL